MDVLVGFAFDSLMESFALNSLMDSFTFHKEDLRSSFNSLQFSFTPVGFNKVSIQEKYIRFLLEISKD